MAIRLVFIPAFGEKSHSPPASAAFATRGRCLAVRSKIRLVGVRDRLHIVLEKIGIVSAQTASRSGPRCIAFHGMVKAPVSSTWAVFQGFSATDDLKALGRVD